MRAALGVCVLLLVLSLGCGKYGPPRRVQATRAMDSAEPVQADSAEPVQQEKESKPKPPAKREPGAPTTTGDSKGEADEAAP